MQDPASDAATRLVTHEAVCAERYGNLVRLVEATTRAVARLEALIVVVQRCSELHHQKTFRTEQDA